MQYLINLLETLDTMEGFTEQITASSSEWVLLFKLNPEYNLSLKFTNQELREISEFRCLLYIHHSSSTDLGISIPNCIDIFHSGNMISSLNIPETREDFLGLIKELKAFRAQTDIENHQGQQSDILRNVPIIDFHHMSSSANTQR